MPLWGLGSLSTPRSRRVTQQQNIQTPPRRRQINGFNISHNVLEQFNRLLSRPQIDQQQHSPPNEQPSPAQQFPPPLPPSIHSTRRIAVRRRHQIINTGQESIQSPPIIRHATIQPLWEWEREQDSNGIATVIDPTKLPFETNSAELHHLFNTTVVNERGGTFTLLSNQTNLSHVTNHVLRDDGNNLLADGMKNQCKPFDINEYRLAVGEAIYNTYRSDPVKASVLDKCARVKWCIQPNKLLDDIYVSYNPHLEGENENEFSYAHLVHTRALWNHRTGWRREPFYGVDREFGERATLYYFHTDDIQHMREVGLDDMSHKQMGKSHIPLPIFAAFEFIWKSNNRIDDATIIKYYDNYKFCNPVHYSFIEEDDE